VQSWPWMHYAAFTAGLVLGGTSANLPIVVGWRSRKFWSVWTLAVAASILLPALYSAAFPDPELLINALIARFLGGTTSGAMTRRIVRWIEERTNERSKR
jgi:hypothetical protein